MCDGERKIWTWQGRLSVNRIAWEKVPQWERGAEGRRYRSTQSQKQVFRTETHVKSYVNTWYSVNTLGNVPQLHLCPITFFFLYIYVHIIYIYIYIYILYSLSVHTRLCCVTLYHCMIDVRTMFFYSFGVFDVTTTSCVVRRLN